MTWQDRVDQVCKPWKGTPHSYGSQAKGFGVDCMRFVDAALSELAGIKPGGDGLERIAPNASLHEPGVAARAISYLRHRHPADDVTGIKATEVEPGDVLVMKNGPHPGHVAIAGSLEGGVWHVTKEAGVVMSGVGAWWQYVTAVYRVKGRQAWSR